jgi:hypothetical protein
MFFWQGGFPKVLSWHGRFILYNIYLIPFHGLAQMPPCFFPSLMPHEPAFNSATSRLGVGLRAPDRQLTSDAAGFGSVSRQVVDLVALLAPLPLRAAAYEKGLG